MSSPLEKASACQFVTDDFFVGYRTIAGLTGGHPPFPSPNTYEARRQTIELAVICYEYEPFRGEPARKSEMEMTSTASIQFYLKDDQLIG